MITDNSIFIAFMAILVSDIVYNTGMLQKAINKIENRLNKIELKLEAMDNKKK